MKLLSGKEVKHILQRLTPNKQKALQTWLDMELGFLSQKFPHVPAFQQKKVGLTDYTDADGVCSHCKNYNMRYMLYLEDIRNGDREDISFSRRCIKEYFDVSEDEANAIYVSVREKIKMRDEILVWLRDNNFADMKYPPNLRVNAKLDVLIMAKLPVPQKYALDIRIESEKLRIIREKTEYYVKYRKYIRYVRLSLKLQPRNPFLLSIQDRMKRNIPLTSGIIEALEKGMQGDWEKRLLDAIENMESNADIMKEHERRLNKLLLCKSGLTRKAILSFRNQLRRGKPLSDKQVATLEKWEQRFADQLNELDGKDDLLDKFILA